MEGQTLDYEIDSEVKAAARDRRSSEIVRSQEPKRTGLLRKLMIAVVLLLLVGAGLFFWLSSLGHVSTDDAQVDGHIDPVSPKIPGNVSEVLVNDNQAVKQGQVLVRIDPRDYQAKLDQARAGLAAAESQAKGASVNVPLTRETTASGASGAEAQLSAEEAAFEQARLDYQRASTTDVAWARANVNTAQANNDRAQADLNRMKPLVDKAEISRLQYDSYVAAARVTESELQAAKDKLTGATQDADTKRAGMLSAQARVAQARAAVAEAKANQQQVNVRTADVASAEANTAQALANLEAAELNLSYTTITAPLDGVVTKKSVEVGQIVQPGQGLMMIIPLQDVWVTANFKETQLAAVHAGQRAEVKADLSGRTYGGHVDSIAGATGTRMSLLPPENATGNYVKVVQRIPVKIVLDPIPGGNQSLRPGMNVDATIYTK
ncbi:MAG TPA: HlyD family secretion protein [Bryobacteraceae bacterium]|nr:HlyD family secretion protein [Bryobacteraceae bacterium]